MQVDSGRLLYEILTRLDKLESGQAILLQPFKKDRSICIILSGDSFHIIEQGFAKNEFMVEAKKIRKLLKTLCKREFPRSKKVWLRILKHEEVADFPRYHRPPIRVA